MSKVTLGLFAIYKDKEYAKMLEKWYIDWLLKRQNIFI